MELARVPMIGVFGPTAAGKTKLGVSIAKAVQGEVVSIDSLQCYSPGGIVTARPTERECEGVNHHLVGYLEATDEPCDFVSDALDVLERLRSRGTTPVLVGGSTSLTLPLLRQAFDRGWKMAAIILLPEQSFYRINVESRSDEMVDVGLLEELIGLKDLEDKYLNGTPDFCRGIWKAIGYKEFYPYLVARDHEPIRKQLRAMGLASLKANTLQYGTSQLNWIRDTLVPFLRAEAVQHTSLTIAGKASWASEVESPAIGVARDFCHLDILTRESGFPCDKKPRVICIFGGSSNGNDPVFIEAARSLAAVLHRNNVKLVYGGGTLGVMGTLASTLVSLAGPSAVHGIIPVALAAYETKMTGESRAERLYAKFGRRTLVKDMHTRKRLMMREVEKGADGSGYVGLSGGYGTLEELLEITTWRQLGIHDRVICLFNVSGIFDGLINWLGAVSKKGFIGHQDADILQVATTAEMVMRCLDRGPSFSRKDQLDWA
ncbi:adenylate dimethylallyltransferase (cytokinin synthase) [Microdochium nivale]|nr:adenylate dimethylallyltransferase (cytokinin synthase) [Microdochium nivale]